MYKRNFLWFLLIIVILNVYAFNDTENKTPGIVLSFDDTIHEHNPISWTNHFDLFDKYGVKVTFFVNGSIVTDFMLNAQNRGHEIGFHTINHPLLTNLTREQFFTETVYPIGIFRNAGIELTTFAYPYGIFNEWMNDELFNYYKTLRGFVRYSDNFKLYTKSEMKSGFIYSASIDNIYLTSDTLFQNTIDQMLNRVIKYGKIIVLTSHTINNFRWGITSGRLEYLLKKASEYGLKFYRFKDLQ